jgi:predicted  nucleic acid-binding Zn-ribbon protein
MQVREATTSTEDLLAGVREGVEEIVRGALAEAATLREEADEKLERYDAATGELTRLRLEVHGLTHEAAEIPERINRARLDAMVPNGGGDDADALERRYIQVRERLPVAEQRIGRLERELAAITSGGSRPAKVSAEGGQRRLVKHESREPALDVLNETVNALERLRDQLPDLVKDATGDLQRERDSLRDGQNQLWGLAKR